ncbi:MAG: tryptophan 7-halogenase [Sphingomonas sp.]|uniref:tryptophan 7-halogenase n=1 Tax=Sphingomonas sp. TaxID=28214 RepID=UPI001B0FC86C|nr:tryptophan 7-halogenase [Sphingomonas sp.]MBO9624389.1 tryptophan 7-halogenase [Sphingomonas sp.]
MTTPSESAAAIEHVVICGTGLAAQMTACAMAAQLPPAIRITLADVGDSAGTDLFYGSVSAPSAYAFNLTTGLQEPRLVVEGDAAFSWGTRYSRWAGGSRSWIQCFHLSLPVIDGVLFHHYLAQQGETELEPYLVSAMAARKGVFAHPPQRPGQTEQLLSRAEYGYQFDPATYARLFQSSTDDARVHRVRGALEEVVRGDQGIAAIRLAGGQSLEADLFIDCTGPDASLLSSLGSAFTGGRRLRAAMTRKPAARLGPPVREVTPEAYGWRSETPLRGCTAQLTVYDPASEAEALSAHGAEPERTGEAVLGRRDEAWSGNCVAIGQAAGVVEPLTPAPLMLLERDIERLLSLIPFSSDMTVERREYNRRSAEDHEHCALFSRALFETDGLPDTPYWQAARAEPVPEKLARKLDLFEDRGLLVAYDLEPFQMEDWTILHCGMGRHPSRYDRSADRAPADRVRQYLANMKSEIAKLVDTLPSHADYMAQLKQYLLQNRR